MADDDITAALASIRDRNERRIMVQRFTECTIQHDVAEGDVRRLLKVAAVALTFHQPRQLHELAFNPNGSPRCDHDPNTDPDTHYEGDDGEWYCENLTADIACSRCPGSPDGEYADWPCPEYEAILAELTRLGTQAPFFRAG